MRSVRGMSSNFRDYARSPACAWPSCLHENEGSCFLDCGTQISPWRLNDQQIADVLNFIRNTWGNSADVVTADEVAAVRIEQ